MILHDKPKLNQTEQNRCMFRGLGRICQTTAINYPAWPNCESHDDLSTNNAEFWSWMWNNMGDTHGPVHVWLGENIDCDSKYS